MENNEMTLHQVIDELKKGEKLKTNLGTKWNIKYFSAESSTMIEPLKELKPNNLLD